LANRRRATNLSTEDRRRKVGKNGSFSIGKEGYNTLGPWGFKRGGGGGGGGWGKGGYCGKKFNWKERKITQNYKKSFEEGFSWAQKSFATKTESAGEKNPSRCEGKKQRGNLETGGEKAARIRGSNMGKIISIRENEEILVWSQSEESHKIYGRGISEKETGRCGRLSP